MMSCLACFRLRKKKKKELEDDNTKKQTSCQSKYQEAYKQEVGSKTKSTPAKKGPKSCNVESTFTVGELAIATNNFSDDNYLGRGGFGAVFRGKLPSTGQVVAVKKLDHDGFQGDKEFLVEVLVLSLMHHPNLVNLIGYCAQGNDRLLVYEYMPLGSLEDHLFDVSDDMAPLDWDTRVRIAANAAKGLECMHCANPPVIYRDLKASNILLGEGYHAKLSDFGLAKFGPSGDKSHVSTRVMGTYGYCAPEYASTGKLTLKTDIYSYGIFLLELIAGRRAVEEVNDRQKQLIVYWAKPLMKDHKNYAKLADPRLGRNYPVSVMNKFIEVASMCLNENATLRPSSTDLVVAMDYLVSRNHEFREAKKLKMSPTEITTALDKDKDKDRDRQVAEAKMWGKTWRDKQMFSSDFRENLS